MNYYTLKDVERALDAGRFQVKIWDGSWKTATRIGPTQHRSDGAFTIPYTVGEGIEGKLSWNMFKRGNGGVMLSYDLDENEYRIIRSVGRK